MPEPVRLSLRLEAARHGLRCRECRVTWGSCLGRALGIGGQTPGRFRPVSVRFMGGHSGRLWWDVECIAGYLVVHAGRWRKGRSGRGLSWPRIYWSPNGTPWHHGARNVFRARWVEREECVCAECRPEVEQEADDAR